MEVKIPNKKMKKKASILFVHGAGHAAWCWRDHFTGWFEALGYTVAAPDLPHHGDLNRDGLKFTPLSAYVDAVAQEAVRLEPPLILIGHSMGGFIIQKYLECRGRPRCLGRLDSTHRRIWNGEAYGHTPPRSVFQYDEDRQRNGLAGKDAGLLLQPRNSRRRSE
jgi:pimeloyl-ACP methyl ester carboxylesterase